jgi:hypothetical protein
MFQALETTSFVGDGINVLNNNNIYSGLSQQDLAYIATSITKTADTVSTNTATFLNTSWLEPSAGSQLPPTSINDFTFFVNGVNASSASISSFASDGGGNMILTFDVAELGYTLISSDEVTVTGKFA